MSKEESIFIPFLRYTKPEWVCCDLLRNINRSDYSLALEKLYPGTAGDDEALLRHWPAVTAKKGIN